MRRLTVAIALFVCAGVAPAQAVKGRSHGRVAEVRLVGDVVSVGEKLKVFRQDCPSVASVSDQPVTCTRTLVGTGTVQSLTDPDHAQVTLPRGTKIGSGLSLEGETLR